MAAASTCFLVSFPTFALFGRRRGLPIAGAGPDQVSAYVEAARALAQRVLLLTFSLGVGAVWWVRDTASVDYPKLFVTLGVWFVYLVVWLLRWRAKLVSVRFAWVCLVMFIIALLSLGPVNSSRHHEVVLTPEGR